MQGQQTSRQLLKEAEKLRNVTYSGSERGYLTSNGRYSNLLDKFMHNIQVLPLHYEFLHSIYNLYFKYSAKEMRKFKAFVDRKQFEVNLNEYLPSLNTILKKYLGEEGVAQWKQFLENEPEQKSVGAARMSLEPILNATILHVFEQETVGEQYKIEQLNLNANTENQRVFELLAAYAFDQRQIPSTGAGLDTKTHLVILLADLKEKEISSENAKKRRRSDCELCSQEAVFECGTCLAAKYCSRECQKEDWSSHKENCC